ncbi:MAG: hypothetical protein QW521_02225 [Desulfurococcaceae archaeon]
MERVRKWVYSLPAVERELPIIFLEGRYWSPNDILSFIEANPNHPISAQLLRMLSMRIAAIGSPSITEIAKMRLLTLLEKHPVKVYTLGVLRRELSPEDLKREIMLGGSLGRSLISIQERRIAEIIGRFR